MGNLPTSGQWPRLEIPATAAGLAGKTIDGMSFVVYEGQAWWDRTGMTTSGSGLLMRDDPLRLAEDSTPPPIALLFGASPVSRTNSVPAGLNRYHFYTPELNLMAETEQTTSPTPTVQYEYIWFGGQPVAQVDTLTSTTHWTFTDHLGTPLLQTDATGAVDWRAEYDPYGSVYSFRAGAARHQPLRLPGQEGEGGSGEREYNIFRWYREGWGRYTQADPLGFEASDLNLYRYAASNPVIMTDPFGLDARVCCRPLRSSTLGRWDHCYIEIKDSGGKRHTWGLHRDRGMFTRGTGSVTRNDPTDVGGVCESWSPDPDCKLGQCLDRAAQAYPTEPYSDAAAPLSSWVPMPRGSRNSNTAAKCVAAKCVLSAGDRVVGGAPGWHQGCPPGY